MIDGESAQPHQKKNQKTKHYNHFVAVGVVIGSFVVVMEFCLFVEKELNIG